MTITNEGRRRIYNLYYHVDWQKRASLPCRKKGITNTWNGALVMNSRGVCHPRAGSTCDTHD